MNRFFTFFSFTEKERKGFTLLASLLSLFVCIPFIYKTYFYENSDEEVDILWLADETAFHEDRESEKRESRTDFKDKKKPKEVRKYSMFYFDPNGLPLQRWKELGFTDRQIQVIKNYEEKGGRFYKNTDLAKIYSISKADYERIAPYIRIDSQVFSQKEKLSKRTTDLVKHNKVVLLNINEADTSAFKTLRGIGTVYAQRIVKYREALGGFYHVNQIKEVYGLSEELFATLEKQLYVANVQLTVLNVNKATEEGLAKHPYINRKQAQAIIAYRKQHGLFQSVEDFNKIYILESDFLRKIEPYLSFN